MSQAFKEWTLICNALGSGAQSVILRKGGIAEGRAGFRFAHADFLLFPTLFHEQAQKLKVPADTPLPTRAEEGVLEILYQAHAEWTLEITDRALLPILAPFHLWRDEVVEERFVYDEKQAISLAFVRVYRLSQPHCFPDAPKYGGCRSWVVLPDPPAGTELIPVLSDEEHLDREQSLADALGIDLHQLRMAPVG